MVLMSHVAYKSHGRLLLRSSRYTPTPPHANYKYAVFSKAAPFTKIISVLGSQTNKPEGLRHKIKHFEQLDFKWM